MRTKLSNGRCADAAVFSLTSAADTTVADTPIAHRVVGALSSAPGLRKNYLVLAADRQSPHLLTASVRSRTKMSTPLSTFLRLFTKYSVSTVHQVAVPEVKAYRWVPEKRSMRRMSATACNHQRERYRGWYGQCYP